MSVSLFVHLSVCLAGWLAGWLAKCLSVQMSVCPNVLLSFDLIFISWFEISCLSKLSSIVEHWVAGLNCLVLVWSWNSFKRDFTIKFKEIEDTIGD